LAKSQKRNPRRREDEAGTDQTTSIPVIAFKPTLSSFFNWKFVKNMISCVVKEVEKWECTVCGYIYDPEIGDPEHGVESETPFEKLPDDWVCPVCGATKDQFIKKE
jgi:rubredoxin